MPGPHHTLSNLDLATERGDCKVCGAGVRIRPRPAYWRQRYPNGSRWECARGFPPRRGHWLRDEATAACVICGPGSMYEVQGTSRGWRCRVVTAERNRRSLLAARGMTADDFERMRAEQEYRCASCGRHEDVLSNNNGAPGGPLVIDHRHADDGPVRGLLCHGCNVGLGMFGDDVARLEAAVAYLRRTT